MDLAEWDCRRTFPPDATRDLLPRLETPYPLPFMLWLDLWCAAREFMEARECRVFPIRFSSFADLDALNEEAKAMGLGIPVRSGLWRVFSLLPAHVEWGWSCGEAPVHRRPFVVDLQRTLAAVRKVSATVWALSPTAAGDEKVLREEVFDETAYFAHTAVPFLPVCDGDYVVLDRRDNRVKYWSHERPRQPFAELGESFVSFMTVWSLLQCPEMDSHWLRVLEESSLPAHRWCRQQDGRWLRVLEEPSVVYYGGDLIEMWGGRAMLAVLPPRWVLRSIGQIPTALVRWWWYTGPDAMRAHRGIWRY